MLFQDYSRKYCVLGGGPSGLTVLKNLLQWGIDAQLLEREDDIGGNWYFGKPCSSVYESTHLISSKKMTQYLDYPMPEDFPEFPSHHQVLDYLRSYARHFKLYQKIELNTAVEQVTREKDQWLVQVAGEQKPRLYAGLIIANGHHWKPNYPAFEGEFSGECLHSHDFKSAKILQGKRVLVVGAGNSGCDIAVEAAIHAQSAAISMRRGYHFIPKFIRGKPSDLAGDRLRKWPLPRFLQKKIANLTIQWALGKPEKFGLPKPEHELFQSHPIINSQLPYYVGHGRIQVYPNIKKLRGQGVEFEDGKHESFDLIIYATGYQVAFPFIDQAELQWQHGMPRLFLHCFHPNYDNLFVSGMIQPNSGQWGITDLQAQVIARFIVASRNDAKKAQWFRVLKHTSSNGLSAGDDYISSERHQLEVDYFEYKKALNKLIAHFGEQQKL